MSAKKDDKQQDVPEPAKARKSPEEEKRWSDQNPLTPEPANPADAAKLYIPKEPKPGDEPTEESPEAKKSPAEQERWKDQNPWTNQDPKQDEKKPVAPAPEPVKSKPGLIAVRAVESFSDGNLEVHFAKYGYSGLWAANEVRQIPGWLLARCVSSGGEFERADG